LVELKELEVLTLFSAIWICWLRLKLRTVRRLRGAGRRLKAEAAATATMTG
jgi:hypothetical protein